MPPDAGFTYDTDFAFSSAALKVSVVERSGDGAPALTPTPISARARSTRLPATTRLSFWSASIAVDVTTMTSARSPETSRFESAPVVSVT